jgi:GNAT superfamily N-acetyltransferase
MVLYESSVRGSPVQHGPVHRLGTGDIRENVGLAHAVGWHDSEGDWRVLHAAALVLGVRASVELIGQGALGAYGESGTIAKMIVSPTCQRSGLGRLLLDTLLAEASARSIGTLGLVATPFGQPLYEQRGFARSGDVVVLTGTPYLAVEHGGLGSLSNPEDAIAIDRRWLGCDRSAMLRARWHEAISSAMLKGDDGAPTGYALATPQAGQALVGPVIAQREDEARALVLAIFMAVRGPIRIDVPGEQIAFREWLRKLGLTEQSVRAEMARGASRLPWQAPQRFALAAQAWG